MANGGDVLWIGVAAARLQREDRARPPGGAGQRYARGRASRTAYGRAPRGSLRTGHGSARVEDPVLERVGGDDVPEVRSDRPSLRRQAIGQVSVDLRLVLQTGFTLRQAGVPLTRGGGRRARAPVDAKGGVGGRHAGDVHARTRECAGLSTDQGTPRRNRCRAGRSRSRSAALQEMHWNESPAWMASRSRRGCPMAVAGVQKPPAVFVRSTSSRHTAASPSILAVDP